MNELERDPGQGREVLVHVESTIKLLGGMDERCLALRKYSEKVLCCRRSPTSGNGLMGGLDVLIKLLYSVLEDQNALHLLLQTGRSIFIVNVGIRTVNKSVDT